MPISAHSLTDTLWTCFCWQSALDWVASPKFTLSFYWRLSLSLSLLSHPDSPGCPEGLRLFYCWFLIIDSMLWYPLFSQRTWRAAASTWSKWYFCGHSVLGGFLLGSRSHLKLATLGIRFVFSDRGSRGRSGFWTLHYSMATLWLPECPSAPHWRPFVYSSSSVW